MESKTDKSRKKRKEINGGWVLLFFLGMLAAALLLHKFSM